MDSFTPTIRPELLEELLKSTKKPEDIFGPEGLLHRLKGALMERMLEAETRGLPAQHASRPAPRSSSKWTRCYSRSASRTDRARPALTALGHLWRGRIVSPPQSSGAVSTSVCVNTH
jgi:hypothetical protein